LILVEKIPTALESITSGFVIISWLEQEYKTKKIEKLQLQILFSYRTLVPNYYLYRTWLPCLKEVGVEVIVITILTIPYHYRQFCDPPVL